ncbi:hypothetical protein ACWATR_03185 [Nostoc sp. UIC 10890]
MALALTDSQSEGWEAVRETPPKVATFSEYIPSLKTRNEATQAFGLNKSAIRLLTLDIHP